MNVQVSQVSQASKEASREKKIHSKTLCKFTKMGRTISQFETDILIARETKSVSIELWCVTWHFLLG